jgi:hypothetical protein
MAHPNTINPDEVARLIMPENLAFFNRLSPEQQAAFLDRERLRDAALSRHLAELGLA